MRRNFSRLDYAAQGRTALFRMMAPCRPATQAPPGGETYAAVGRWVKVRLEIEAVFRPAQQGGEVDGCLLRLGLRSGWRRGPRCRGRLRRSQPGSDRPPAVDKEPSEVSVALVQLLDFALPDGRQAQIDLALHQAALLAPTDLVEAGARLRVAPLLGRPIRMGIPVQRSAVMASVPSSRRRCPPRCGGSPPAARVRPARSAPGSRRTRRPWVPP